MPPEFAAPSTQAIPLHLIEAADWPAFRDGLAAPARTWLEASGFTARLGQWQALPAEDGAIVSVVAGYGDAGAREQGRFHLAGVAASLPEGDYQLHTTLKGAALEAEALGWLLSSYAFTRYKSGGGAKARLVAPQGIDVVRLQAIAAGECLTRDLINTPTADMGPAELERAVHDLAEQNGAEIRVIRGDELLTENFPMIHAVGRASEQAPRLIDLRWGQSGPTLVLVGKGVCFDTGGLNLKPGSSMGLMKKDMGGAAAVLGLAHMIMSLGLPLKLRVLIPAVENSVAGNAFRPQDVLRSRKGLTVEVNNTDAEGRLVLADALALADEEPADLIVSMATLTGAARVAVGPDLAPFYANDDGLAAALSAAGGQVADPLWRMPFHTPYEKMIEPDVADLDNAPKGGFAGSITAALFLRRFVANPAYVHFDIYGWQPSAAPARPKGGVGQGTRALLEALPEILEL